MKSGKREKTKGTEMLNQQNIRMLGDLRKVAISQTLVKDLQQTLV